MNTNRALPSDKALQNPFLFDDFLAAHVRSERNRNVDAAVGIEIVFEESNQHSRRRHDGVVEGVGKIFAVFAGDADFQTARLRVA